VYTIQIGGCSLLPSARSQPRKFNFNRCIFCPIRIGKQHNPIANGQQHELKQSNNPWRHCPVGTSNATTSFLLVTASAAGTATAAAAIGMASVSAFVVFGYGTSKLSPSPIPPSGTVTTKVFPSTSASKVALLFLFFGFWFYFKKMYV
jgi:hypothetical protein